MAVLLHNITFILSVGTILTNFDESMVTMGYHRRCVGGWGYDWCKRLIIFGSAVFIIHDCSQRHIKRVGCINKVVQPI